MTTTTDISAALAVLNAAVAASASAEKYRSIVANAVAEGRDVNDAELGAVAGDLDAAIDRAEKA